MYLILMNTEDYNYSMEVKYYFIYKELIQQYNLQKNDKNEANDENKNNKNEANDENKNKDDDDDDNNENYTLYDIECICQKIYMDEYASVFNCDSFMDDMIDMKLRRIYTHLTTSSKINQLLEDLTKTYNDKTNISYEDTDSLYYTFVMLFSYDTFHLVHKLLNAHFNNTIDDSAELFNEIYETFNKQLD